MKCCKTFTFNPKDVSEVSVKGEGAPDVLLRLGWGGFYVGVPVVVGWKLTMHHREFCLELPN